MVFRKIEKKIIKIDPVLTILSANERSHTHAPCTRVVKSMSALMTRNPVPVLQVAQRGAVARYWGEAGSLSWGPV